MPAGERFYTSRSYCEYMVTNTPTFLHSYTVQRERDELVEANNSLRKRVTDPKQEIQQWQQQFLTFCLNIGTSFLCLINYCRHQLVFLHTSVVSKPHGES